MTLDPRPTRTFTLRTLTAFAAVLFLATGLVACGPDPAEVDESPVAGMTEENPSDDEILGDDIVPQDANDARLTLSGTPTVEGDAEVACAVHEAPAAHAGGTHGYASQLPGEEPTPVTEGADGHGEAPQAAEHTADAGTDDDHRDDHQGVGGHGGGDEGHGGGHLELTKTATFALNPPGDAPLRLVVEIPQYHGAGEYEARLRLEGIAEDGSYAESTGTGTATVETGTRLASDAGTHWIGGTFEGTYAGDAGDGEASGSVERCYYFK